MVCPASSALEATLPETTSPYAEEGTRAHTLSELCLLHGWQATALPESDPRLAPLDRFPVEMREHVQVYLDRVRAAAEGATLLIEQTMDLGRWLPGSRGTADAIILRDRCIEVWDLKYGAGVPVDPERNPQLMLYGLGALEAFGSLILTDKISLTVAQPRLNHIESWTLNAADLLAWGETAALAARATREPDAPFVPGASQCRFCRAKATCRARAEQHQRLAHEDFAEPLPAPNMLTLDELARLLPRLHDFEQWAADVRTYALEAALCGVEIPGHKLVEGRSVRQWRDEPALAATMAALGIDPAQLTVRKMIGITAAEKALGGKKKAAPLLDQLTVRPPGKPVLVEAADPRPVLTPTARAVADFHPAVDQTEQAQ
jgi:hypothetical protein